MIKIDDVYQKVLVVANREQRGYLTPQEFNLIADKAQLDILGNYFHDIKTAHLKPKNQSGFGDEMDMLSEKLQPFRKTTTTTLNPDANNDDAISPTLALPNDLYAIESIHRNEGEIFELSKKEILLTENHPLTKATINRTVYVREGADSVTLYPTPVATQAVVNLGVVTQGVNFTVNYFKKPELPKWGYVVVNEKALYSSTNSIDFELHASEEETLVTRILELAGIVINRPDLQQAAMVDKQMTKQEQNN